MKAIDTPMEDAEEAQLLSEGFDLLFLWCRNIALLPVEDWIKAFEKAESLVPIIHSTLYQKYVFSEKAKFLKELISTALSVKEIVLKMQPLIETELKTEKDSVD